MAQILKGKPVADALTAQMKKDVEELPKEVKKALKIHYMSSVDDAYKIVFGELND